MVPVSVELPPGGLPAPVELGFLTSLSESRKLLLVELGFLTSLSESRKLLLATWHCHAVPRGSHSVV